MAKSKFKELRIKFLSVSMIVTALILIILQGILYLHAQRMIALPQVVIKAAESISLVIATLFIASLLLRLTIKRVYNLFDEPEEKIFYSKIYTWTLYSIGLFFILYHFGVSLGNITIFIGLIATGLAFAIRDVLMSFFGWIILLRKKPFRIGDYIRIGEDEGKVIHIGTFYVLLDKTPDIPEDYSRVPNRLFLEKSVNILGKNSLQDQILLNLSDYPKNPDQTLKELKSDVESLLAVSKHVAAYIDIREGRLCLVVDYNISFDEWHQRRSEIIALIFNKMNAVIYMPK